MELELVDVTKDAVLEAVEWLEDKINANRRAGYDREVGNWNQQYWNNGRLGPIPIPPCKVDVKVLEFGYTPAGQFIYRWAIEETQAFVREPWTPSPDELRRMPERHRRELGLPDPPAPESDRPVIGPLIPNYAPPRYSVGAGDTVAVNSTITHPQTGEKLQKRSIVGFGGIPVSWYQVL